MKNTDNVSTPSTGISHFCNASTNSLLDEIRKRNANINGKIFDASCALEKIKLIAYGFNEKYNLESGQIDDIGEKVFLERRLDMGTEMSVLSDYILKLDNIVKSLEMEN